MQVAVLKAELAELRASKSATFSLPSTGDVLTSLGLDKWKDDRLKGGKVGGRAYIHPRCIIIIGVWSAGNIRMHAVCISNSMIESVFTLQEKSDNDLENAIRRPPSSATSQRGLSTARKVVGRLPVGHGQISARVWLIVAYLVVLHVSVMIGFTKRNDLDSLCRGWTAGVKLLPGT